MDSATQPLDVLCVGDLVADIFASPVARLPQPGELTLSERIAIFPGGNALNAAIVLRRLGHGSQRVPHPVSDFINRGNGSIVTNDLNVNDWRAGRHSIASACAFGVFVSLHNTPHELMPHDVFAREVRKRHARHAVQYFDRILQAGLLVTR